MNSLGDMAQFFASNRTNFEIKSRLNTLAQELSSGRIEDLSAALKGDTKRLADIDRRITIGSAQIATAKSLANQFDVMQLALGSVSGSRDDLVSKLIAVPFQPDILQVGLVADAGRSAFESMVASLNTRYADQSLFAGTASDTVPLSDAGTMLSELRLAVAGAVTVQDVQIAVTDWFNQPGGGFETLGYLGDTADKPTRRVDDETTVEITPRANDPAFRELLAATAMAALADDNGLTLSTADRATLLGEAKTGLISAAASLANVQANLGQAQSRVESADVRLTAQISALSIMRNDLVTADPFDTASELEQVQIQLETHYTVTARLSRLSLTEYLR